MPSSRLFILDNMIRNKQGSKFVKPAVMQQTLAILFATLKTYYNQQANRLGHHNLQKKKWGNHHKFLLQAKIPLGAKRLGFNKIFSQSVSLTQYVVLFVCLSVCLSACSSQLQIRRVTLQLGDALPTAPVGPFLYLIYIPQKASSDKTDHLLTIKLLH